MTNIQRVLCPVDFSACSEHAADYATDLAERLGAEICFFHAWDLPVYAVPDGALAFPVEMMNAVQSAAETELAAVAARHHRGNVHVTTRLGHGSAAHEIVRAVKDTKSDLVVVGTHGRTGLSRMVLGSVAERTVRTSPVPVLTVPMPH